jgi:hypothetical protein
VARTPRRSGTQGYEREALHGGTDAFAVVVLVEAELSLLPTYDCGPLFGGVVTARASSTIPRRARCSRPTRSSGRRETQTILAGVVIL